MDATLAKAGIQAEYTGDADQPPPEQGASEALGILVALIVLLIVFRTFVAAGVPILFAFVSVLTAFALLFLLANLTDFNTITPILVSMIGIGVGVDYTLFIVTRFRQALHDGMPPREAAAYASTTAGRAVIFAGVTVAISITGLAVIGIPFITKLGMGGALGVLTAVLYATFLLPGLLSMIGHRIDRLKVPLLRESDESEAARSKTIIGRWGAFTVKHSGAVLIAAIALILLLALPVLGTRLGTADASTASKSTTGRQAYDLLTTGFGAGFNGPVPIVVDQAGRSGRVAEDLRRGPEAPEEHGGLRAEADLQQEQGRRPRRDLAGHEAAGQGDRRPHLRRCAITPFPMRSREVRRTPT